MEEYFEIEDFYKERLYNSRDIVEEAKNRIILKEIGKIKNSLYIN